ncbi:MAG: hypothetical protein HQ556_08485 [Candidatus Marinimicrobia bacterium]|nr:hypothetical protein [Candidatus Neomarinimicrobiota bacterium]
MIGIIIYLIVWLIGIMVLSLSHHLWIVPEWYSSNILAFMSVYMGILGGIIYLLRNVYIHRAVRNDWDPQWYVWYYIRPLTSSISGFVSYIFLKAGLLVLDAKQVDVDIMYGYLAFAFIAGYNVDNFMKKIEEIARTLWGINKTGTAQAEDDKHKSEVEKK